MIDKLDLRVPAQSLFAHEMAERVAALRKGRTGPFKPSSYYRYAGDLRKAYGIDAILHLELRKGDHNHKIEIIDAGSKTLAEMMAVVQQVFNLDPRALGVMRVDLAADVPDIPVSWFREHARFQFKRFASWIDKSCAPEMQFIGMSMADAQSLYAGRKPNCFRIYNKVAELKMQWLREVRRRERFNRELAKFELNQEQREHGFLYVPSFEEFCRWQGLTFSADAVLTRVERQIGGDRIPFEINTVAKLEANAADFDPFDRVRITASTASSKRPEIECWGGSVRDYLAGVGLQTLVAECGGVQQACSLVNRHGKGNGGRVLDRLRDFLPEAKHCLTASDLRALYRTSVERQLTARQIT